MPTQFVYDPPWWLLLLGPEMWLEYLNKEEFLARYVPKMEQFLRALKRQKTSSSPRDGQSEERCLSTEMRRSWETGRFWFDYAARKSLDIDNIYWNVFHEDGADIELLDEETRAELIPFTQKKMMQLEAYEEEYAFREAQQDSSEA